MTFTYLTNVSDDISKVRLLIGDKDCTDALLQDEEITYFLTAGGSVNGAAVIAARAIASNFSRLADKTIETVSVSYSQKSKQYLQLANSLEKQGSSIASGIVGPSATGISIGAMESADNNADRPEPAFKQGMFDDPPTRFDKCL